MCLVYEIYEIYMFGLSNGNRNMNPFHISLYLHENIWFTLWYIKSFELENGPDEIVDFSITHGDFS